LFSDCIIICDVITLQASTRAFPDIQVRKPAAAPLWAIILSICVGILILLLIILLLCKVYKSNSTFSLFTPEAI